MYIEIHKADVAKIANGNLQGGGKPSDLEVALAKKCMALYERLDTVNNERNAYFEAIYSATLKFDKATDGALKRKRASELAAMSKRAFAQAVKLDDELKGINDELGNTDR